MAQATKKKKPDDKRVALQTPNRSRWNAKMTINGRAYKVGPTGIIANLYSVDAAKLLSINEGWREPIAMPTKTQKLGASEFIDLLIHDTNARTKVLGFRSFAMIRAHAQAAGYLIDEASWNAEKPRLDVAIDEDKGGAAQTPAPLRGEKAKPGVSGVPSGKGPEGSENPDEEILDPDEQEELKKSQAEERGETYVRPEGEGTKNPPLNEDGSVDLDALEAQQNGTSAAGEGDGVDDDGEEEEDVVEVGVIPGKGQQWPDPTEDMPREYLDQMADAYSVKFSKTTKTPALVKKIMAAMY